MTDVFADLEREHGIDRAEVPPPGDEHAPYDPVAGNGQHPTAEPYRLLSLDDLAHLEPPRWRIDKVLPDDALSIIFGVQSTYKSFIALDWALSIAAGVPWLDHDVQPGVVVYVAAEGGPGLHRRIRAWQVTHEHDPDVLSGRFRALPHAVDLRDPVSVERLTLAMSQLDVAPALVVVDTWAKSTPGADENSVQDTSAAVGKLDGLRTMFGCGVLVVHHAGLETGRERGSTSLGYAADCRWESAGQPNADTVTLKNHKQREWETSPPVVLRRHVVGEGDGASLIVRLATDPHADHRRVVDALDGAGALTTNKLLELLPGNQQHNRDLIKAAADCVTCPVMSWSGPRNAQMYIRRDQQKRML